MRVKMSFESKSVIHNYTTAECFYSSGVLHALICPFTHPTVCAKMGVSCKFHQRARNLDSNKSLVGSWCAKKGHP